MGADDVELPISHIQNNEIWMTGVFRYARTWPLAIQLVASGQVTLDPLVTHFFPLARAEEALQVGSEPGAMKAVVRPNE